MKKVSEEIEAALIEAKKKKEKSGYSEFSWHAGSVSALESILLTAQITELKNEKE